MRGETDWSLEGGALLLGSLSLSVCLSLSLWLFFVISTHAHRARLLCSVVGCRLLGAWFWRSYARRCCCTATSQVRRQCAGLCTHGHESASWPVTRAAAHHSSQVCSGQQHSKQPCALWLPFHITRHTTPHATPHKQTCLLPFCCCRSLHSLPTPQISRLFFVSSSPSSLLLLLCSCVPVPVCMRACVPVAGCRWEHSSQRLG